MWILPKLSSPLPVVTAGSLKLQGHPVFSSHYEKPVCSYIWNFLSEKTQKEKVKFLATVEEVSRATQTGSIGETEAGVQTAQRLTPPSRSRGSVLLMTTGNVSAPQFVSIWKICQQATRFLILAWNKKPSVGKIPLGRQSLDPQLWEAREGRVLCVFPLNLSWTVGTPAETVHGPGRAEQCWVNKDTFSAYS